ncbi:Os02g0233300 [Oryza sativa Japonica Group]|uniref:Os02g0233300 protein n=1 Tax=Oryza sativa subsp. japonica TaxID=39947 RepID=C7IYU0_ORYSJ|nr:Os02g0233300 [Oryza sativa Japonica Group]|eukprot:NP_001172870.1 Os02g0233300 [Oryza sativa Japonica Group]
MPLRRGALPPRAPLRPAPGGLCGRALLRRTCSLSWPATTGGAALRLAPDAAARCLLFSSPATLGQFSVNRNFGGADLYYAEDLVVDLISALYSYQMKNSRWKPVFALETGGPSNADSQDFEDDGGFLGRTRLGRLIQAAGRELLEKLNSARSNSPTKIFLVLFGFYTANALATILGQTGDWDVLVAGVVVAAIEGIGMLMYRKPMSRPPGRFQSLIAMVNYWKAGEAKVRECLGDRRRRGELDAGWEWWIVEGDELLLDIICHSPLGIGALLWVWRIHTVHAAAYSQRVTIQLPTMGLESRDATSGGDLRSRAKDDSYHNPQAPCKEELGAVTGQRRRWW